MSDKRPPPNAGRRLPPRPVTQRNASTIRLRRIRSLETQQPTLGLLPEQDEASGARPRARTVSSRPTPGADPQGQLGSVPELPPVAGIYAAAPDPAQSVRPQAVVIQGPGAPKVIRPKRSRLFRGMSFSRRPQGESHELGPELEFYDPKIVDMLDCIDPEVSTLSSITNVQNSLFVPSLGKYVNRQPVFDLEPIRGSTDGVEHEPELDPGARDGGAAGKDPSHPGMSQRQGSLLYDVGERYAVLPNGVSLEGWTEKEVAQLNDLVRHMLHSKVSRMKRSWKGFRKYVKKPLGFLVTLYGVLITLFGLAWVLFLIGWIYVGEEKQLYVTNVIDYVLVALFAIVGDGLAPFRAIDTYHMFYIAHYHRLTWKLRKKMDLPKLQDRNDLPTEFSAANDAGRRDLDVEQALHSPPPAPAPQADEIGEHQPDYERVVLTPKQQARLIHHQTKFAKSHTFYKPHETETHHAFPLSFLIAIVLLLDLHSCLQISLGAVTWGIDPEARPMALTATILSCSITANVTAGILISMGDHRTRKKEVVECLFRQELTETALKKMRKKREKELEAQERISEEREKEMAEESSSERKSTNIERSVGNLERA